MIHFDMGKEVFNFRVGCIIIREDEILIHRGVYDSYFALPGGRVEFLEETKETIIREIKEEIGIELTIERLVWIAEQFFKYEDKSYHELGMFYLLNIENTELMDTPKVFYRKDNERMLEFKWIKLNEIENYNLYPAFIKDKVRNIEEGITHIVDKSI